MKLIETSLVCWILASLCCVGCSAPSNADESNTSAANSELDGASGSSNNGGASSGITPRLGVVSNGHLLVKEGSKFANWVDLRSDVRSGSLSRNTIAVVTNGNHCWMTAGELGSSTWIDEYDGAS